MVAVDIFGFILGLTVIFFVVRPIAQAVSDKLRKPSPKQAELDQTDLQARISFLESEVQELKRQLTQVQETSEFMNKYIETARQSERIEQKKNA